MRVVETFVSQIELIHQSIAIIAADAGIIHDTLEKNHPTSLLIKQVMMHHAGERLATMSGDENRITPRTINALRLRIPNIAHRIRTDEDEVIAIRVPPDAAGCWHYGFAIGSDIQLGARLAAFDPFLGHPLVLVLASHWWFDMLPANHPFLIIMR